jgi:hypothetical protein
MRAEPCCSVFHECMSVRVLFDVGDGHDEGRARVVGAREWRDRQARQPSAIPEVDSPAATTVAAHPRHTLTTPLSLVGRTATERLLVAVTGLHSMS